MTSQAAYFKRYWNREEHDAVPAEFGRWVWAGGRRLKGLVRRREAEADLYERRRFTVDREVVNP